MTATPCPRAVRSRADLARDVTLLQHVPKHLPVCGGRLNQVVLSGLRLHSHLHRAM